MLVILFLLALGLSAVGTVWHQWSQREREAELLFVGDQYRRALLSYAAATPAGQPRYPETLEQLLNDERTLRPTHHLRRLYRDPMTGGHDWGVVRAAGRIIGVYSKAQGAPIRTAFFPSPYAEEFTKAASYADWRFLAEAMGKPGVVDPAASGVHVLEDKPSLPVPRSACEQTYDASLADCVRRHGQRDMQVTCVGAAEDALSTCQGGEVPLFPDDTSEPEPELQAGSRES